MEETMVEMEMMQELVEEVLVEDLFFNLKM